MPSIILSNAGGAGTGEGGRSGLLELGGGGFESFDRKNTDMIPRSLWRDVRLDFGGALSDDPPFIKLTLSSFMDMSSTCMSSLDSNFIFELIALAGA